MADMKKLVIFDLDGTLTNTVPDIEDNVNKTMRKFGYPEITADEARRFVGNGAKILIERSLKGVMPENFDEIVAFYNDSYNFCGSPKTCVYDGMSELLKELKADGYLLAVVSNKPQDGTTEVIRKFFGDGLFDYVYGQREGVKTKPSKEPVEIVLKSLSVEKRDAVYVGDSEVDVLTAKNSGLYGISVLWGFREKELLVENGATVFAATARELREKIENYFVNL